MNGPDGEVMAALASRAAVAPSRRPKLQGSAKPNAALLFHGEQHGIAPRRRRVDGDRLLGREAGEVMRPAGLRAGAREAVAAEGLHPDDRPDHVAVDID